MAQVTNIKLFTCKFHRRALVSAFGAIIATLSVISAVNLDKFDRLTREQLLKLDREVSRFYDLKYHQLDELNVTYDEQMLTALRSVRHTIVVSQLDYVYSDEHVMRKSFGAKVDLNSCKHQVETLVEILKDYQNKQGIRDVPISAVNFLESNGRVEPGILEGNFLWHGSEASCNRGHITAETLERYSHRGLFINETQHKDIRGRYCIAHLRAKSWPKDDLYFGDRLTLKLGLCLPDTCHSVSYADLGAEFRAEIDYLSRSSLRGPFNSDRYEISALYCTPDEDSEFRQLDLGAIAFISFCSIWFLLTIHLNVKYQQRSTLVKVCSKLDSSDTDIGNRKGVMLSEIGTKTELPESSSTHIIRGSDLIEAFSIETNISYMFNLRNNSQVDSTKPSRKDDTEFRMSQNSIVAKRQETSEKNEEDTRQGDESSVSKSDQIDLRGEDQELSNSSPDERRLICTPVLKDMTSINIRYFDGVKVIATAWIVAAHWLLLGLDCFKDVKFFNEKTLDFAIIGVLNALQIVGVFYMMTGFLIAYLSFTQVKNRLTRPSFWFMAILMRYLRLIPTYLLVFWFARHVGSHLGSGADWADYRTDKNHIRTYCGSQTWWPMLTLSSGDVKIPYDCLPQAWYLTNDFRTLFVLPFYVGLLAINTKAGYLAAIGTIALSYLKLIKDLRNADIDYQVILEWNPHTFAVLLDRLHPVYTDLWIRLSTYLIGLLSGHLVYLYQSRKIRRWHRLVELCAVKVSGTIAILFFFGPTIMSWSLFKQLLPASRDIPSEVVALLVPLFKFAMELSIGVLLMRLATGGGYKWIISLLSSRVAKVLSNASYAVFLIHFELIYKLPSIKVQSNYWILLLYSTFVISFSWIIALALHLFYEIPIRNTIRVLRRRIAGKAANQ